LYVECLAYADDVLLLSGSVCLLQKMLNIRSDYADELDIRFNAKKYCLLNIGNTFNKKLENLQLNGLDICWFDNIKYLCMQIVTGKALKVDVSTRIHKFYVSANALFCSSKYVCELTRLCLCESFVLPILTYGCEKVDLSTDNINRLNVCWNDVYQKNFGFHRWESVKVVQLHCERLNLVRIV